ncbi:hypothetical protein ACJ73_02286 [Blastomyces percursus]|uniref:Uncharacterized protein n=1 Tax=Blastomyces percursus TaxID=1658174 RepID=A0A1J9RE99_9EURO|nr:hypothetical protein ACJ73_02286 [Blastomyces percursus]
MGRDFLASGNNDASKNHHHLIPTLHKKDTTNKKASLANETKSPPPQIDPKAFKTQHISKSNISASTQASSASEPVLHLRGGGALRGRDWGLGERGCAGSRSGR